MKVEFQIHSSESYTTNKPWIVLINGLFASLELWDSCADLLKEDYQVLRYNCQGQGDNPEIKHEYLLDDHVNDLFELLKSLRIDKAHLLGISNGGRIALKFASVYPQHTLKVIACDTYDKVYESLVLKIESWLKAQNIGDQKHRFDISSPWIFGETYLKENKETLNIYRDSANKKNKDAMAGLMRGALSGTVDIESIKSPVLYLVGEEDVLTPPFMHKQMVSDTKDGTMKLIRGGHASLYEYPDNIKNYVLPYLQTELESTL
jgi:3-oxoadipate enol-lactonase